MGHTTGLCGWVLGFGIYGRVMYVKFSIHTISYAKRRVCEQHSTFCYRATSAEFERPFYRYRLYNIPPLHAYQLRGTLIDTRPRAFSMTCSRSRVVLGVSFARVHIAPTTAPVSTYSEHNLPSETGNNLLRFQFMRTSI